MKKLYFKKLISSLIFSGAGLFTLLFFAPLEVILGNPTDFRIPINATVIILGVAAVVATLVFSLLVSFLPTKTLKMLNLCILGVTLCYYVQSLFLNGELIRLDGEKLNLSNSTIIINAVIWLVIFAAVLVLWLIFKKASKEKLYITATKFIAGALVIMQITGFLSLYLGYDKSANISKELYFSTDGRLEVSSKNNVIYFIIDYCDSTIVNATLKEDPALFDGLEGFTYYPNNLFTHCRSYPAITYLLTGEKCYYDTPDQEFVNQTFKESSFIKTIDAGGTDIRVYTDSRYAGADARLYVDNYKSAHSGGLSDVKPFEFICQALKVSGFRGMPYAVKKFFAYDTETVNDKSLVRVNDFAQILKDLDFYDAIKNTGVSVNEKYSSAFRFYHMYGSHPGATVNENAEYAADVTLTQALRGDLKIIKTYLSQLRELGVYDNTTVIITADHGEYMGSLIQPQTCLLLVKEAGADSNAPIKTSTAPVSHEDLFATTISALGGSHQEFGTPVGQIAENSNRTRYHYNTELGSDGKETVMKEYAVEGDARDLNNYRFTGNQWKVNYSIYK